MHLHVEETIIPPVGTPRITTNPVLGSIIRNTITDNRNLVVYLPKGSLGINSTIIVVLKFVCGMDTARNWTMSSEFSFHFFNTTTAIVVTDIIVCVIYSGAVSERFISCGVWWTVAVTTHVNSLALAALKVVSSVLLA